jgi:hypothetical protein
MTIEEFNRYPKNLNLFTLFNHEVQTKEKWIQDYILNNKDRWKSVNQLISELHSILL